MDYLKKKAMLDTAAYVAGCIGATTLLVLASIYIPMLPFTAMDYGFALSVIVLLFMIRMAYKLRLEELQRRARYAEKFLEKKGLL